MNKIFLLFVFIFYGVLSFAGTINKPVSSLYGFIENKGQIIDQNNQLNPSVLYLYNGNGLHVQLKQSGFSYEVWKVSTSNMQLAISNQQKGNLTNLNNKLPEANSQQPAANTVDSVYIHRIDISFVNANPNAIITASQPASDYINYYTTGTSEQGVTNVHHYKKVLYQNIYPNIDVEFLLSTNNQQPSTNFKYNFIVHPGGNPNDIQLKFDGANNTSLTKDGHIIIETAYGNIDESIPYSYQLNEQNNQQTISASFITHNSTLNTYGLNVGTYDANKTLIIDPAPWATYYGGSSSDFGSSIASDIIGNVFITGETHSSFAIATSGAYQTILYGNSIVSSAFISKFSSSGALLWGTYYGSTGSGGMGEKGYAIAIDAASSVYIAGYTSSFSSIATSNGFQSTYGGSLSDAFVVKFDSLGMRKWGTYYGADSVDAATAIAVDSRANVYVTGYTHSLTGIATSSAFKTSYGGGLSGSFHSGGDAFIVKFDSSGTRKWGTYYGGTGDDQGNSITTDVNGFVYLTGNTFSSTGIASSGAYNTSYSGGGPNWGDAFIVRFDSLGTRQWATYFGGAAQDAGFGITSDTNSNIYITGVTGSSGIATSGAFQSTPTGGFITKFSVSGVLQWATYYGDYCNAITSDIIGNLYITGYTYSTSGIATSGSYQSIFGGAQDAFITKFNSLGNRLWATYYGGSGADQATGITNDLNGNTFITGYTNSTSGIATSGAYQTTFGGSIDVFIAKFTSSGALVNVATDSISGTQNICNGAIPSTLIGSMPTGGNSIYAFKWQKSTQSATNGFINAGGNDSSQNYSPQALTANTWYRRALASGGSYDTTSAIAITIKLRTGFTTNNANQCFAGNSFIFNDTTLTISGTLTRKWYFGAGVNDTSILTTPTKTYSTFGTYSVKLVSIGSNGCADSVTKTVTVYPKPSVGFTINSSLQQCFVGNNFGFTDTSTISSGALSRVWNFGENVSDISTAVNPAKTYSRNGTFTIKLISSSYGCKDSITKTVTVYPKPILGFTVNISSQCLTSNNFLFNDTSNISSGTINRQWNFGTGYSDTSSTINPNKVYTGVNTYSVKLIETSNNGCKDSLTKNVIVNPKPSVGFTINSSSQCLTGNNFLFSDTSSINSGTLTRQWNFGTGASDTSSANNPNKVYTSANNYSVKLLSISNNGCKDSIIKTVTVNPKPNAGFTTNNPIQCLNGNNFLFTDTTTINSGTITRHWNFGTGTNDTSSSNNPNKVYTSVNTYSVKLISTSNNSCKDSITKIVTVNPKPIVGFTINNISQCLNGNNFIFTDTSSISSGTITRNWDLGNGTNSTIVNPSISYSNDNTYQVKIISTSNNGCKDSVTKTVMVNPKPNVGFTQNILSQCLSGNSFVLNDTTNISSGTLTRLWNFGDATTSSNTNTTKSYSSVGTYQIKLVVSSNNNCKDSISKIVSVYSQPKSGFTIDNSSQCLIGNSFSFNDTTNTAVSRLWDLGDLSTNTNDTFSKTYTNVGTYSVKLKVADAHNCSDSSIKIVTVKASPAKPIVSAVTKSLLQSTPANSYQWYLNNTSITSATNQILIITSNGSYTVKIDSTNGCSNLSNPFAASTVGIAGINNTDNEIRIYPNPTTNELHIETSGTEKLTAQLFDMTDKEVSENIMFIKSVNFYTELLSEGMYFVRITDANGAVVKMHKVAVLR